ncbi:MAG: hypothetical protein FJW38_31110 [Acidobacteria bacterium]|nr:hypothetical protein [Acidobacteriota bacterium]
MPAPNVAELYKYEESLEAAFVTILSAASVTAVKQRNSATVAAPYVAIQLQAGTATGRMKYYNSKPLYDAWSATLQTTIVTERLQNDASHSTFRAKVRELLYDAQAQITTDNLPYHAVTKFFEGSSSPQVEEENNHDVTVIQWVMEFQIRSTAWP